MKTIEYLEACKAKLQIESDYRLSKELGLTRSAMSAYRNSGVTFSRATAKKVAKILGIHPMRVLADAELERAKTPEDRALWRDLVGKLSAIVAAVGLAAIATSPADARFDKTSVGVTSGIHIVPDQGQDYSRNLGSVT